MKKLLPFVLLAPLALCFALESSYAMKRDREEENALAVAKRCSMAPKDRPASFENPFPQRFLVELFPSITAHLDSKDQVRNLRLVSKDFKRLVDRDTTDLDLSSIRWVPLETMSALMGPNGLFSNPLPNSNERLQYRYVDGELRMTFYRFSGPASPYGGGQQQMSPDVETSFFHPFEVGALIKTLYRFSGPVSPHGDGQPHMFPDGEPSSYRPSYNKPFWRSGGLIDSKGESLMNPFIGTFSDLFMDLRDFPNLQALNLAGNTAIKDDSLALVPNLTYLNLKNNRTITDNSVRHLTNLTSLDLENTIITDHAVRYLTKLTELNLVGTSGMRMRTLDHLTNLQILKLTLNQEDTGEAIKLLPNLNELSLLGKLEDFEEPRKHPQIQQMINIAEALFSLIENSEEQRQHPALPTLKRQYENSILSPNILFNLGHTSTYPFNREEASYTWDEMVYMTQLARGDEIVHMTGEEENDTWNDAWRGNEQPVVTIEKLLEIMKKDLKVFVYEDGNRYI